jgi:4-amino-4-deoxy-L-arabinose transferase-like glycosyltransferase
MLRFRPTAIAFPLCLALLALIWCSTLALRPLYEPDEGRYAEVAREMLVSNDWVTPRLNGITFFDKPPLQYWATALAYRVFGVNEGAARLWSATAGLFAVGVAWWSATRLYGRRVGMLSAMVLFGAGLWIVASNLVTTDIGIGALLGSAVLVFAVACHTRRSVWFGATWLLTGLAFLAKGLIALVLPGIVLLLYAVVARQWRWLGHGALWRWVPLALLVAVPWVLLAAWRNPAFAQLFFLEEHLARFTSTVHGRDKPIWFFAAVLLAGMVPWTTLVPGSLRLRADANDNRAAFRPTLFLSLWVLVVLAFFSLSQSKLPLYILPLFPPLAVLIGRHVATLRAAALAWHFLPMLAFGTVLILLANGVGVSALKLEHDIGRAGTLQAWGGVAGLAFVGGAGAAAWLARRERAVASVAVAALASLVGMQAGLMASRAFADTLSVKALGTRARTLAQTDTVLYNVGDLDRGLAFYAQRLPVVVAARAELAPGIEADARQWLPSEDAFVAAWQSNGHKLAVMRESTYLRLRDRMGGATSVNAAGPRVLVEKR